MTLDRREFFQLLGGGVVVALAAEEAGAYQDESGGGRRRGFGEPMPQSLAAWLHIGEDGAIAVYTGKAEMGQNIRTSLTQVVAEELHVPLGSIHLVMGDTDLTPYDMGTFGSRTTPTMAPQLRPAAAAARALLIELAAERWKTGAEGLVADGGKVRNPANGQALTFSELTKGQKLLKTIGSAQGTPAAEWKVAGHSVSKVNGRDIVTGKHQYTPDVSRPGMLVGKVLRPPAFQAELASVDTKAAEAIPGVVAAREGNFVGVAATDEVATARAVAAIRAEWKTTPQPSQKDLWEHLRQTSNRPVKVSRPAGDVALVETYTVAYIAHTPLEPRAAVAEWSGDKLTVWTGTQRPFGVRSELAQAFQMPEQKVRVIVPDTGAGYGGKHTGECAIECARLAKAAGKPVKLVWTREEEFTWAYFRPAGVIDVASSAGTDGKIQSWEFHNYNSGPAGIQTMYDIPNKKIEYHSSRSPLRQGSYRGLAATANHFAREVHMDELAHAVKMDPLEFRLKNCKDARLRAVLTTAAERFGWKKAGPGTGYGIAGGFEKGSYVASCVEVAGGKLVRVVTAYECGAILNPDQLKNQVEGAVIMALGGALFEEIQFDNGRILNPRLSQYRVPRFADVPKLDTVLIDRKDLPSAGAGETPIVALAPAISNAIFDATGVRHRSMPIENRSA